MTKLFCRLLILIVANSFCYNASSQSLGVNTSGAVAANSAILDISSTDKGMLIPRMNKTERNAITAPATGLLVFQNAPDSVGFYYHDGSSWQWLAAASGKTAWLTSGSAGTSAANNFFGTTDNVRLSFRQNNKWLGMWDSGTDNYFIGDSAGNNTTGISNIAIGSKALWRNASGYGHIAIGSMALNGTSATYPNTAIGISSQENGTTGYANTSLGSYSLARNKTGINNTAIGNAAMYLAYNPANPANVNNNTAVGNDALRYSRYSDQVAVGSGTLSNDTSGTENTAVGYLAMNQNLSGLGNAVFGSNAMYSGKSSNYNTAVGFNAYYTHQSTGYDYNTAVGSFSMEEDSSGYYNTAVGTSSLRNNVKGFLNTGIGINAGYWQKQSFNTFIGAFSGVGERTPGNNYAVDSGRYNTGIGAYALYRLANGNRNVAVGNNALYNDSSGVDNVGVGINSLSANVSGSRNTGIGQNANVIAGTFTNATAIGADALAGQSNCLVLGSIAGINSAPASTRVGIGETTPVARLHVKNSGSSGGTFIANASVIIEDNTQSYIQLSSPTNAENGMLSGNAVSTVRSGIAFAPDSSLMLRSGGNTNRMTVYKNGNVGIGTIIPAAKLEVYEPSANVNARITCGNFSFDPGLEFIKSGFGADWKIRVANTNALTFSRAFDDFVGVPTNYYEMEGIAFKPSIDFASSLGQSTNRWATVYAINGTVNTSDLRDKENVENLGYGLKEIMKLRPVTYNWKANPQWGKKIGFIAQEVKPILAEVVLTGNLKGRPGQKEDQENNAAKETDKLGIYYSDIIPVVVKGMQEQQALIEKLTSENVELKARNARLEKNIALINERLGIKD